MSDIRASNHSLHHKLSSSMAREASTSTGPDVLFSSTKTLFRQLDALSRTGDTDSLVVGRVSVNDFRAIEARRDRSGWHYRLFFQPDPQRLIVTIPTRSHERAHLGLYGCVQIALHGMGMGDQWLPAGATTYSEPSGASGEGDSSGGPATRDDQPGEFWPTLVIETGLGLTLPSLREKARWWFAASSYRMKVVVLMKLIAATSAIEIEQWVTESKPHRQGATNTRASRATTARTPVMRQQLTIKWAGPSPLSETIRDRRTPTNFCVTGAPLVLRFEDLLERPPVPAAGEHDVVISENELQLLANKIWY